MPRYRLDIEYDGTDFSGWQVQPNGRSVQEEIEKVLAILAKEKVRVVGAGRTDAGVHAKAQTAHFETQTDLDAYRIRHSLNAMLPEDMVILGMRQVPPDFHARFSAKHRQYAYRISLKERALQRAYFWHVSYKVDWDKIRPLLLQIEGEHDFKAFCATGSDAETTRCNVHFFSLEQNGDEIVFTIRADRFLYKMVRSLVGTLVDIGRGRLPEQNLAQALLSGERKLAGDTAPAKGLVLVEVGY